MTGNAEAMNQLINNKNFKTPLHHGSEMGQIEVVDKIIAISTESVNLPDSEGMTPLHHCSQRGHIEVVNKILEISTESVNVQDKKGMTPLHISIVKGEFTIVKSILSEGNPSPANIFAIIISNGKTCLEMITEHGDLEIIQAVILLLGRTNINFQDDNQRTILHFCSQNGHIEVVNKILAISTESVNLSDSKGMTPLHHCSQNGHIEVVQRILRTSRSSLEISNSLGLSPWGSSIEGKQLETAKLLLPQTSLSSVYR